MFLVNWLERLGILKPRYREGWPRGVRPVFPTARPLRDHIVANDPALWDAMCKVTPFDGLMMAQEAGLLSGVRPGAPLGDVQIIQRV